MTDTIKQTTIADDMGWILKVLLSCKNQDQIKVSDKLFNNFIKKWKITSMTDEKNYVNSYNKIKFIVNKKIK